MIAADARAFARIVRLAPTDEAPALFRQWMASNRAELVATLGEAAVARCEARSDATITKSRVLETLALVAAPKKAHREPAAITAENMTLAALTAPGAPKIWAFLSPAGDELRVATAKLRAVAAVKPNATVKIEAALGVGTAWERSLAANPPAPTKLPLRRQPAGYRALCEMHTTAVENVSRLTTARALVIRDGTFCCRLRQNVPGDAHVVQCAV